MATIADIADLVHPTVSGLGIITTDQIWVLFDREIDESTVAGGNFFITGPDFDTWSGPDLQIFHDVPSAGSENEILQSPGYNGILQGDISFERVALNTLDEVTTLDEVGSGFLYRTKAIFTPTNRLQANTEFKVFLSGDESSIDTLYTGIKSRTVFDPVTSGANTGTGTAAFDGGYDGFVAEDIFRLNITTAGDVGDSKFTFVRDSDPLSVFGPFLTRTSDVLLADGVSVAFTEGDYELGDEWSVVVKEANLFDGNLFWPFKTGSGSIETIPDSTATSVLGDPDLGGTTLGGTSTSSTALSVSSTVPADNATHLDIPDGEYEITITFNKAVEASTVISGLSVNVIAESVTGEDDIPASGTLIVDPSVSGAVLTLAVADYQLLSNNLITVTLDDSIESTDGNSLSADYEFSFTTHFEPMYCTLRRLRVMIGAFIQDVADNTVNMAIYLASKEADSLTWNTDNLEDDYYKFARSQWTCCRAAEILLINTTGASGRLKSKRLGDLAVEYDTSGSDVSIPLAKAENCLAKWEGALMAGGRQVQRPSMVVKGERDLDRPPIGRGWVHTRSASSQTPVANNRTRFARYRRYRNMFVKSTPGRRGWWNR